MRRRTYLALLAGVLSAGCAASGTSKSTVTPAPEKGGRQESTTMAPSETDPAFDPDSTFKTVEITDDIEPHDVLIWNAKDSTREIAVQISKRRAKSDDTETLLDKTYEFPADDALEIRLIEPATYSIEVAVPAADSRTEIHIQQKQFDCNAHLHQIAVWSDGSFDVSESSTLVACDIETDT